MTERNERKVYVGEVVSDKMDKTIVVEVALIKQHPKYRKRIKRSTKLTAHDEDNIAKDGDKVKIMETRPLSKTKRFRLVEVVEESIVI
ncbi:MAG: 30S ribosomal protein S17 [Atopostipes sp.]|nr:30S ribosomal protein S17 [Atopostipes sp.]